MEFLKRKHFSLWIITSLALVASLVGSGAGLQGVPTWIYLGLKSPFIEFSNEFEILANTSIPLNITKDEQAVMHQEGLRKLGSFIKPVDLRDSMTGFVKANLTKKISTDSSLRGDGLMQQRIHPIQEEMDQKQIILLDEDTDENGLPASLTDEDRKFIVPMALKNASPDPRLLLMTTQRTSATTTTKSITPKPSTAITTRAINKSTAPEFASNIDDLKNHILYLQNLTKHDSSFQSKFVVFPSLKKDKQKQPSSSTTIRPMKHLFQYSAPIPPPTRKPLFDTKLAGEVKSFGGYYHDVEGEENRIFMSSSGQSAHEKINIVPQVLLLNDQTSERSKNYVNDIVTKQRNLGQNPVGLLTTTTTITSTTPEPSTTTRRYVSSRRPTKKPQCLRNPESLKCIRQRRREELQRQHDREQLLREQQSYLKPHFQPIMQTINNTKRFAVSIEIPDSFKIPLNASESSAIAKRTPPSSEARSRSVRSHHNRRNIGVGNLGHKSGKYGSIYLEREAAPASAGRDFLLSSEAVTGTTIKGITSNNMTPSPTVSAYSEPIDLNPDLCYQVDVMSYGQKKQCVLHTSVMPAISRGARAAIQECEHQFQNRRWNCSTTDDTTVFGPMTGLGSPEMAFIHGLAAATVTSFIARACRDGQLASCGCSRGSRPKQLHDDWTWGGCGDDLEYAYKFATDFIDVRERETKRGTRGAGNPERRRGKFHQRRLQQQQQQAQAMQADDAMAAATTSVNDTKTTTNTKTILGTQNTTFTNGHINNNQANSNKTVNNVAESTSNSNSNVNGNNNNNNGSSSVSASEAGAATVSSSKDIASASSIAPPKQEDSSEEESSGRIKAEDLLELQERIAKEILNSKLQEKEMHELQEKINREILNSRVFNMDVGGGRKKKKKRKNQRAVMDAAAYNANNVGPAGHGGGGAGANKWKNSVSLKARSLMNLHNNEAGRRAVIKKTRITCKCHGVSGSCSLITCWQQLSSIREIGEYLREKYEEATEVKLNKRGRLQVKDAQFKVPTAHDLVYLDESPDWCRHNRQLQWPGTHGRICNKTSSGLDGCGILCCGRGYNTKNIVVRERCNCKFHWCCQVKCEMCVKVLEEHTCK